MSLKPNPHKTEFLCWVWLTSLSKTSTPVPLRIESYQKEDWKGHAQERPCWVPCFLFVEKVFSILGLPWVLNSRLMQVQIRNFLRFRYLINFELICVCVCDPVFCRWISTCPSIICWEYCSFSTEWSHRPCQNSVEHRRVHLFLDSEVYSIIRTLCSLTF